jgi:hypothetical protein
MEDWLSYQLPNWQWNMSVKIQTLSLDTEWNCSMLTEAVMSFQEL